MNDLSNNAFFAHRHQQIGTLLEEEHQSLESLLSVLEEENKSIGMHDLSGLEEITIRKQRMISKVEQASKNRMALLQQLGIDPHKNGWSHQLQEASGKDPDIAEPLKQLVDLTRRCQGLNRTNGLALNHKQQLTTKLMGVLRDDVTSETYSGRGMSESNAEHRILGKA